MSHPIELGVWDASKSSRIVSLEDWTWAPCSTSIVMSTIAHSLFSPPLYLVPQLLPTLSDHVRRRDSIDAGSVFIGSVISTLCSRAPLRGWRIGEKGNPDELAGEVGRRRVVFGKAIQACLGIDEVEHREKKARKWTRHKVSHTHTWAGKDAGSVCSEYSESSVHPEEWIPFQAWAPI